MNNPVLQRTLCVGKGSVSNYVECGANDVLSLNDHVSFGHHQRKVLKYLQG